MSYLNFTIQPNKAKYDDFTKYSHEGKTLKTHIEEVLKFSRGLLNFYRTDPLYEKVAEYLAFCHDLGKLQKGWRVNNPRKNPPHSEESVRIILDYLRQTHTFQEKREYQLLLLFFIAKHHSRLGLGPFSVDNFKFDIPTVLQSLPFNEKINLVDAFGIFKLSDSISADSKTNQDIDRKINEITKQIKVSSEILRTKLNITDTVRWQEQLKLTELGDVALLQAPTGWGKTTTSLLFSVNKDFKRIFYLLPTITAIRDFKKKLEKIVGLENVEAYFYFYDVEKVENEGIDLESLFFTEHFLKPVIITTIDQFLLTFLQVGKYHLKRVNFRKSLFIIDEIHLFSPLMLKLFFHFFNKFRSVYNLKLLVMSATLTDAFVNILKKELKIKDKNNLNLNNHLSKKLRVRFLYRAKDLKQVDKEIIKKFREKKKILVIVNTVDKAITLGRKLIEDYRIKDIIVFHSRFIFKHRLKKEKEILEENREKPHILVCTQIAEVSLDISYDFLFTELAPFASLVQRFGRVNRYGEDKVKDVNCLIFYPHEVDKQKKYPYGKDEVSLSLQLVRELASKKLESEQEIYDKINALEKEQELKEAIEKADENNGFYFDVWEKKLDYFYALSMSEETLNQVLNYREGFTTLALLGSGMIEDSDLSEEMDIFLREKTAIKKDFEQRRMLTAKAKELSLPVPFYLAKQSGYERGFPILKLDGYSYNYKYGLYKIAVDDQII